MKGSPYLQKKIPFNSSVDIFKAKPISVKYTLQPVPEDEATLEAERGEVAVISDDTGLPTSFKIAGQRHSSGGTKLNLPPNSFIFSRDNSMKIKDPKILSMFNMAVKKSGYSPAEIAKKYDINNFRKVLADKTTDKIQRDSAESMIRNYNEKLAQLALLQESKKGFPTGIPTIAMPYMTTSGLDPAELFQQQSNDEEDQEQPDAEQAKFGLNVIPEFYRPNNFNFGGEPKFNFFKKGGETNTPPTSNRGEVTLQYGSQITPAKSDGTSDFKKSGGETLRRVKVIPVDGFAIGGQPKYEPGGNTPPADGTSTYSPKLTEALRKLNPNLQFPEDVVESKQQKSGVGYGRFNKEAADKNWSWYGKSINWNNPAEVKQAQKAYNDRVYQKAIDAGHGEDIAKNLVKSIGFDLTKNSGSVNAYDGAAGKFTESRIVPEIPPVDKAQIPATAISAKKTGTPLKDVPHAEIQGNNEQVPANYWLQDVIKTAGAAADQYRIKKYMPWQAPYNPYLPQATFYDPSRELGANSEQANMAEQTAGMFGIPQQLSARLSQIQGQAGQQAANILGKYNNMNVSAANQNEQQRTGTLNEAAVYNADRATNLFDKTTIANQQFDNAKAIARQNLRGSFLDAITNRAQTQALNSMTPQYQVDPTTGGIVNFTKGKAIRPEGSQDDAFYKRIEEGDKRLQGLGISGSDLLKYYSKGQ